MEIERKWMVQGGPRGFPCWKLTAWTRGTSACAPQCASGAKHCRAAVPRWCSALRAHPDKTGLMREEIETEITPELFEKLERLIGKPLIAKERRTYALKNGLKLEVNDVDAGLPSHFMYAEVEYPDEPTARAWTPADDALTHYLSNECTGQPGASMGEYWTETRK